MYVVKCFLCGMLFCKPFLYCYVLIRIEKHIYKKYGLISGLFVVIFISLLSLFIWYIKIYLSDFTIFAFAASVALQFWSILWKSYVDSVTALKDLRTRWKDFATERNAMILYQKHIFWHLESSSICLLFLMNWRTWSHRSKMTIPPIDG